MAAANEERVTRTFLDLVRIDSPTFQEQAICRRLAADLEALGLPVENDGTGRDGVGNLIARLDGGPGLPIALSAHFDTVQPGEGIEPVIEGGIVRSTGDTILGSDDKAGVAAILVLEMFRTGRGVAWRRLPDRRPVTARRHRDDQQRTGLALAYHRAWTSGDIDTAATYLADDIVFGIPRARSPAQRTSGDSWNRSPPASYPPRFSLLMATVRRRRWSTTPATQPWRAPPQPSTTASAKAASFPGG